MKKNFNRIEPKNSPNHFKIGVVGYRFSHYSPIRNIIGVVPEAEYIPVKDVISTFNGTARRLNLLARRNLLSTFDSNNQFNDLGLNKVDIIHLFNGISYGHTPWVSTFETLLPRFRSVLQRSHGGKPDFKDSAEERKVHKAFKVLAGPDCKKLIAMSNCSLHIQKDLLSHFDEYRERIENKLVVLQPPQPLLISGDEIKQLGKDAKVKFMFVGSAFYRKGGMEIVETLARLRESCGYDIELTLVSSFKIEDYATRETPQDIERARDLVQRNSSWIRYHSSLPNQEVIKLMKAADVGLLPTYADTYGYSVLEFQAAGCPVISTDVRALPEMNNNDLGWLIEVPKNRLGEAIYTTPRDRQDLHETICQGLETAVHSIFSNPGILKEKSAKVIANIRMNYSMEDRADRLRQIYLDAVHGHSESE